MKNGGWATLDKTVDDIIEVKVRDAKEDLDTLLVFVSTQYAVIAVQKKGLIEYYQGWFIRDRPYGVSGGVLQNFDPR